MLAWLKDINCCHVALFLAIANIIEVICYLHYSMQLDMNMGTLDLKNNDLQKEIARLGAQNKMAEMKINPFTGIAELLWINFLNNSLTTILYWMYGSYYIC
ncbi:unnamed protein product [Rhizophagus irregularis]|nr:unnamed protein product [Rhizophagus irregularis]CAB5326801.1 unnamed protein product [Rhizophagus irregularis]